MYLSQSHATLEVDIGDNAERRTKHCCSMLESGTKLPACTAGQEKEEGVWGYSAQAQTPALKQEGVYLKLQASISMPRSSCVQKMIRHTLWSCMYGVCMYGDP